MIGGWCAGGSFIPDAMGLSKQYSGSYLWGFVAFAVLALLMLVMLRVVQIRWTRTWAEAHPVAVPMRQHRSARPPEGAPA